MSNLRDIQKLRQTKNLDIVSFSNRNPQYRPQETYNINFDKLNDFQRNSINQSSKYGSHSKQGSAYKDSTSSNTRRGSVNTNEPNSPALSVYSNTFKAGHKSGTTNQTSRKEKQLSTYQFQANTIQMIKSSRLTNRYEQIPQKVGVHSFQRICPIGKGGFGKVWKVEMKKTRQIFAMKQMYKAKIIQKKSINSVMNERNLLSRVRHPFFININYAFQDRQKLYLIMDYINGGDLRYHIGCRRRFTQIQTKFFIANLIVGLDYLCQNRIIHRDLKPQNLVIDSEGYIRITDLGVSREYREQNYQDTSGTPGYMAPEVICRRNHSYTADYFAVGVMAYEFMLGKRPYVGKSRKEIRDNILSKQAVVKLQELPNRWSLESVDFINKLLQRNPNNRLGYNGINELKKHDWMKNIDFAKLQRKELKAPYLPLSIEQNYDDYKQQISQDTIDENLQQNLLMLRDEQVQCLFEGYQYEPQNVTQRRSTSKLSN